MTTTIHPSAVVEKGAQLGEGCVIGAFAYLGPEVTLGDRCSVGPHCVLHGKVTLGAGNTLVSHAAIGGPPQDISFKGEFSEVIIGDDNVFREFVTINRATTKEQRVTRLGSRGLYMAYAHVAHDCHVGDNVIFANNATLAGHVHVGKHSTVGALSAIHQFCTVGDYAFIGGGSIITRDVLPYVKTVGARGEGHTYGINTIGLQRKGFSAESIEALRSAYRTLFHSKLLFTEAVATVEREMGQVPEVAYLVKFIRESKRGIQR
jgi:UDP-N-acetylglucosamine acyltransferase